MDISRHRYFYDRIAENEMNDRNRDEIRRRMIPFPYIDSVMVRQNSDSVSGHDYIYNYVYSLPVTDGMKKLRVRLESIVEATDRSTWRPAASDTLLFIVASLSDLVDRPALDQYVIASAETDSLGGKRSRIYSAGRRVCRSLAAPFRATIPASLADIGKTA